MERYDVIIVGAGVIGMSSAYHLQKNNPNKRILVIDKEPDAGQGNTAKAYGMVRNAFSSRTNRLLADTSVSFYLHIQNDINYDIGFRRIGYLWLMSKFQFDKSFHIIKKMIDQGIEIKILGKHELKKILGLNLQFDEGDEEAKYLGLQNIDKGLLSTKKCGELNPSELARFWKEEFEKLGGETLFNTRVDKLIITPDEDLGFWPIVWQGSRVDGVLTKDSEIYGDKIVLATSAFSNKLLDPIGIDNHSKPIKTQGFQLQGPDLQELMYIEGFNEENVLPFTLLPTGGVSLHRDPTQESFWIGCSKGFGRPFNLDVTPEKSFYEFNIHPIITKYFPQFETARIINMIAGSESHNTIDSIPYVFERNGLIIISGCGGSAIIKADAIGRSVNALYQDKEEAKLFGNVKFKVSDLSMEKRNVEKEEFHLRPPPG